MKPGDVVRRRRAESGHKGDHGLFMGLKKSGNYEYAEVMWLDKRAPNGDVVSTIQKNLIELVKEAA